MKKGKFYAQIVVLALLSLICLFFLGCTIYFQYYKKYDNASVFVALAGSLLTLIVAIIPFIQNRFKKDTLIEKYLNDEHFVDRDTEYTKLLNLIKYNSDRIIYINGKLGMGKTLFMKMSCDRINFTDKKKWKSYAAFYYNNNHTKTISKAIAYKFCGNPNASVTDISNRLEYATLQRNSILFIDNIYESDLLECTEFAKAFINCNDNNQIVIAVDSNNNTFHICPGKFGENEIALLAQSYNMEIEQDARYEISELSNGYPVYARYSVEAYTQGLKIVDYNSLEIYIGDLINSLNELDKASLALIICLSQILQDGIETAIICGIDNRITNPVIKRLITYSFVNSYKDKIYTDKLIALKCMDFLSEYRNECYEKIYQYYKKITSSSYIALVAALKSNFKYDYKLIKDILHKQYDNNNFYLLIDIGELELGGEINPYMRDDAECWIYIRYYYLKSLLELGLYDKAKEVVDNYDNLFNLLNVKSDIEFEYQYLLVDLEHLTNYLKDAATFSYALLQKASTKEQLVKCQYLYAHCLRHIGDDLDQAYTIFTDLVSDMDYEDDKIRIRSIYSAASIKMFQGELNYPYEDAFDKIEQIICKNENNETWKPYVARHKAIYQYKICKKIDKAEQILQETIIFLKVTPLRIKYDIYFELGEIYRIRDNALENYEKSINYYLEAEQFAQQVHDYNLQSNAQLGIMLLNIKYGIDIDDDILNSIISQTNKIGLKINYNCAMYLKYLIKNENIPQELVSYWEKIHFSDLASLSQKSKSEKCNLKLTVM